MSVQVFVGFGGSGGRTLKELARLLSEDFTWARLADRNTFFLLVDTDIKELEDAAQSIKNTLSREGGDPWIQRIGLADGVDSIAHLIDYHMNAQGLQDPRAREALERHWWHRGGLPFTARRLLASPEKGAGQCPLVSRFLAWKALGRIDEVVRDLLRNIRARVEGEQFSVDLVLTGSLAGGTGRGCWSLLSFRIRQMLADQGISCQPFGYFFDQGCFSDVMAAFPDQEHKLKVNALTGLSELVMWIRNDHQEAPLVYRLPSLEGANRSELDAIDAHRSRMKVKSARGASPVDAAFVIFESSKSGTPDSNHAYFYMLATCLYARTVNSEIWSQQANSPQPLYSLGSASYEIPATSLLEFMVERGRQTLVERLIRPADASELQRQAGELSEPLHLDGHSLRALMPKEDGNLIQRIVCQLRQQAPIRQFLACLEEDNLEDAMEQADLIERSDRAKVEQVIHEAFGSITGSASPASYLKSRIQDLITGAPGKESVATARLVVRQTREFLLGQTQDLPSRPSAPEDQRSLRARTEEAGRKEFLGVFGRRFNEQERQNLEGAARNRFVAVNFEEITKLLRARFAELALLLQRYEDLLERIETLLDQRARDRRKLADHKAVGLFTQEGRLAESVPGMFDATRYVRRVLKPVVNNELIQREVEGRLNTNPHVARALGDLYLVLRHELEQLEDMGELTFATLEKVRGRVDGALESATDHVDISHDFIKQHFNFEAVVRELMRVWSAGISATDRVDRGKLMRLFAQFFGLDPEPYLNVDGQMAEPDLSTAVTAMGASLAATCDPFFVKRSNTGAQDDDRVILFLPGLKTFDQDFAQKLENSEHAERRGLGRGFQVRTTSAGSQERNPFAMITFAVERFPDLQDRHDFGGVESVNYWRNSASITEWLEWTERADGESVFSDHDFNVGIGHVDPLFVQDEAWSKLRWKPWAESRARQVEAERTRHALVIAYAMVGNQVPGKPHAAAAEALARITGHQWQLPLLLREETGWRFTRRAYQRELGKPMELGRAWETDDTYANVNQLQRRLATAHGAEMIAELNQEQDLFAELFSSNPEFQLTQREKMAVMEQLIQFIDAELVQTRKQVPDPEHRERMLAFLSEILAASRTQLFTS
jgi:hypothetical protein